MERILVNFERKNKLLEIQYVFGYAATIIDF